MRKWLKSNLWIDRYLLDHDFLNWLEFTNVEGREAKERLIQSFLASFQLQEKYGPLKIP